MDVEQQDSHNLVNLYMQTFVLCRQKSNARSGPKCTCGYGLWLWTYEALPASRVEIRLVLHISLIQELFASNFLKLFTRAKDAWKQSCVQTEPWCRIRVPMNKYLSLFSASIKGRYLFNYYLFTWLGIEGKQHWCVTLGRLKCGQRLEITQIIKINNQPMILEVRLFMNHETAFHAERIMNPFQKNNT